MTTQMSPDKRQRIRHAVRFFYDVQKLRIQSGNRSGGQGEENPIALDEDDVAFMQSQSDGLEQLESTALKEVTRLIKNVPIYKTWLKNQSGCGPTMAGVILSEIDIHHCDTMSQLWSYCGLGVAADGRTQRRQEGKKAGFNPWLKGKMVNVLAGCIIKASGGQLRRQRVEAVKAKFGADFFTSPAYIAMIDALFPGLPPSKKTNRTGPVISNEFLEAICEQHEITLTKTEGWVGLYENYKHRKTSQILETCMNCKGSGKYVERTKGVKGGKRTPDVEPEEPKSSKCANCQGTGGPAPWGYGAAHRNNAAKRYMIKIFLRELWRNWRTLEGLEVGQSYAEKYLGMQHGDHGPDPVLLEQSNARRAARQKPDQPQVVRQPP